MARITTSKARPKASIRKIYCLIVTEKDKESYLFHSFVKIEPAIKAKERLELAFKNTGNPVHLEIKEFVSKNRKK